MNFTPKRKQNNVHSRVYQLYMYFKHFMCKDSHLHLVFPCTALERLNMSACSEVIKEKVFEFKENAKILVKVTVCNKTPLVVNK